MYAVIKTGGKQYRVQPGDLLVTYIGRLAREKNLELLLRAWTWVDLDARALVYPKPIFGDLPQGGRRVALRAEDAGRRREKDPQLLGAVPDASVERRSESGADARPVAKRRGEQVVQTPGVTETTGATRLQTTVLANDPVLDAAVSVVGG